MSDEDKSVTIIGAGIVGICCALSLQEKGWQVHLIDRDEPGQGASMGNAGIVSPWSVVPQSMPGLWKSIPKWLLDPQSPLAVSPGHLFRFLPWAARFLASGREPQARAISHAMANLMNSNIDIYRRHLSGTGHEGLLKDSNLVVVSRKALNFPEGLGWQLREIVGAPMRQVSGPEIREIEPTLSPAYNSAVIVEDQARAISPGRIGQVLAEKVRTRGGVIQRAEVQRLYPNDDKSGWTIELEGQKLGVERVVVAAGAWSAKLLQSLGVKVPLEAEGGYHTLFKSPGIALNNSISDIDYHVVSSSMEHGLRTAGTAEFAGINAKPNYGRARLLIGQTKSMFPDLDTSDVDYWRGTRPSFPDSLPAIGAIEGLPNLFAAFGHSHYGLGMAPVTGMILAETINGNRPNIDMAPYSIHRF